MSSPFERLERDRGPVDDNVFVVMPYGRKEFVDDQGETVVFDFDEQYDDHYAPLIRSLGMTPVRGDSLYSGETVLESVWRGLQEGAIVLADLTGSHRNVMIEFAWAYMLGKKIVPVTQCKDDMPSDLPGLRYVSYTPLWKDMTRMEDELKNRLEILRGETAAERKLVPMETGSVRPATARVVSRTREHVVVEADQGRLGVLGAADVEWGRIVGDMTHLFSVGQVLHGAFETVDGYTRYTLLAGQANPWHSLANEFPEGHTFTGRVVNIVEGLGAFVLVAHGVKGLVPEKLLPPVDIGTDLRVGVVRLDVAGRKIQLRPVGAADRQPGSGARRPRRDAAAGRPRVGERHDAEVVKTVPEDGRSGGYALVRLVGGPTAMLHCTQMSAEVRADLNLGEVELGELLQVEVVRVNDEGRLWVRDIPDLIEDTAAEEIPDAA
ncbi:MULTISPECIES: hypothetical protein [unclassified Actinomadura]|uniref:hypothetical protein n=1 Tax=unclassified Actinomadura TaxID=2626254 RepID=UPI0011EE4F41|nr:hypothetical protein [Actinomadura sp. K4S16]